MPVTALVTAARVIIAGRAAAAAAAAHRIGSSELLLMSDSSSLPRRLPPPPPPPASDAASAAKSGALDAGVSMFSTVFVCKQQQLLLQNLKSLSTVTVHSGDCLEKTEVHSCTTWAPTCTVVRLARVRNPCPCGDNIDSVFFLQRRLSAIFACSGAENLLAA